MKVETKYKIRDRVWILDTRFKHGSEGTITFIKAFRDSPHNCTKIIYNVDIRNIDDNYITIEDLSESDIFKTRKELQESI